MTNNKELPTGNNGEKQGQLGNAESENDKYEELALDIIRDIVKLGRQLDVYDVPLLAKVLKDALQHVQEDSAKRHLKLRGKEGFSDQGL